MTGSSISSCGPSAVHACVSMPQLLLLLSGTTSSSYHKLLAAALDEAPAVITPEEGKVVSALDEDFTIGDDAIALRKAFANQATQRPIDAWQEEPSDGSAQDPQLPKSPCGNWPGVTECIQLPGRPIRVTVVTLGNANLTGSIDVTALSSMTYFKALHITKNHLSGPVEMAKLPRIMFEYFDFRYNEFSGPLDLTQLPLSMTHVIGAWNKLTGPLDLTKMPGKMTLLMLGHNGFSGSVDLTRLPSTMIALDLSNNKLAGSLDLTQLPDFFKGLLVENNTFSGPVDLSKLPVHLDDMALESNEFSGALDLRNLSAGFKIFTAQQNLFHSVFLPKTLSVHLRTLFIEPVGLFAGPSSLVLVEDLHPGVQLPPHACFGSRLDLSPLQDGTDVPPLKHQIACPVQTSPTPASAVPTTVDVDDSALSAGTALQTADRKDPTTAAGGLTVHSDADEDDAAGGSSKNGVPMSVVGVAVVGLAACLGIFVVVRRKRGVAANEKKRQAAAATGRDADGAVGEGARQRSASLLTNLQYVVEGDEGIEEIVADDTVAVSARGASDIGDDDDGSEAGAQQTDPGEGLDIVLPARLQLREAEEEPISPAESEDI